MKHLFAAVDFLLNYLTSNLDDVNEVLEDSRRGFNHISEPELEKFRLVIVAGLVLLQKEAATSDSSLHDAARRIVPGDPKDLSL